MTWVSARRVMDYAPMSRPCSANGKHGDDAVYRRREGHKTGHGDRLRLHFKHLVEYGERQFKSYEPLFMWSAQDYIDRQPALRRLS